ncbi:MAG: imelysin family protein [Bacteroidota bacterium]
MNKSTSILMLVSLALWSITACGPTVKKSDVVVDFADLVFDSYQAAHQDAIELNTALKTFTENPDETSFEAAKNAWKAARESYGVTETFRFQDGPIDLIEGESGPEARLNAWPLDEGYVDYVEGAPLSGIVNDTTMVLNKNNLIEANEREGEENVSIGYHAIEFLLWGQDLSNPMQKEAGNRPYTDFVDGGTAANQARRRSYLNICADLLIEDLQILLDQWEAKGPYRQEFLALDPDLALGKILTGMATLAKAELAGERMFVAYDNQDQEDEHSCFSDNTHRDTRLNLLGIKHAFFVDGPEKTSIHKLIQSEDPSLAKDMSTAFSSAEEAVDATAIPFDFAITDADERKKILIAVNKLRALGDKLVEAGNALGVNVGTELPE